MSMTINNFLRWILLYAVLIRLTISMQSPPSYPLLYQLINTTSKDAYIKYVSNLVPGTDRYTIGGESIELAREYLFHASNSNAERVLICFSAYAYYHKTNKWENVNVHRDILQNNDIIFRGYYNGDNLRAEITGSELWELFYSMWIKYHTNQNHTDPIYPIKIINNAIIFNLDTEYESHSTNELDGDEQRGLRFTEGGDEIAARGYYDVEIPIKNIDGIKLIMNEECNDIAINIKTKSYVFDVNIDSVTRLLNNTYQIDDIIISGKNRKAYNSVVSGHLADIQFINKYNRQILSETKRIRFLWRHYEIIGMVKAVYYSHPQITSQQITLIVECFGRESYQIDLLLTSHTNNGNSYRLKLLDITGEKYVFQSEQQIISGKYYLKILSSNGDEISDTKIGYIQNNDY
eukprot:298448_1